MTWARRVAITIISAICVAPMVTTASAASPAPAHADSTSSTATSCVPVILYFSRGSGESAGLGPVGEALRNSLKTATGERSAAVPNNYPAVSVWDATVHNDYTSSVTTGIATAVADIQTIASTCPASKIVVSGYSQGAEVSRYAVTRLPAAVQQHIAAIALFGDPWFHPTEANITKLGGFSPALKGLHYANTLPAFPFGWFFRDYPFVAKEFSPTFNGRIFSFCHPLDIVCQADGHSQIAAHLTYSSDNSAYQAANLMLPYLGLGSSGGSPAPVLPTRPVSLCQSFVSDITVPDGTVLKSGSTVTKTWRLRNCGTSPWQGVRAQLLSGNFGSSSFAVPTTAAGATATVSVNIVVPSAPGHYRANYRLVAPSGAVANNYFWVDLYSSAAAADCESFDSDVTVSDGTPEIPGGVFTKTWRLRNCGTTSWTGLTAVRVRGSFGPATIAPPLTTPGHTGNLTSVMTTPVAPGTYRATYQMRRNNGTFLSQTFWVEIAVLAAPANGARYDVISYNAMTGGAPHHGYFDTAFQPFVAQSNRITYLSATVGSSGGAPGSLVPDTLPLKLCADPACTAVLASANPQIVNYGNTGTDIGDVPVTAGQTYYIWWGQPAPVNGSTWVTFWWAGGSTVSTSDQMQAAVLGYNALRSAKSATTDTSAARTRPSCWQTFNRTPALPSDGDLNGDQIVNVQDLSILLSHWAPPPGDSC